MRKALRVIVTVVVALLVVGAVAYGVNALWAARDAPRPPAQLHVDVLAPGTFDSAHPYAPYYVVPRSRFSGPSELSRLGRSKLVTKPESALAKGAIAGSPQVVRVGLRAVGERPVTVEGVRFRVVSDARPVRGWYTALPGCVVEPVRRARANLDRRRPRVRYTDGAGKRSRSLALEVRPGVKEVIELHAATARRRVAWTAELSISARDRRNATVLVDDRGKPFRVTSVRASQAYEPVYGAAGITSFRRARGILHGAVDC